FGRRRVGGAMIGFLAGGGRREGGCALQRRRGSELPPCYRPAAVLPVEPAVNLELLHPPRVGIEDFELERPWPRHELTAHRHSADARRNISGKGVHLLRDVTDIEFATHDRGHVIEIGASIGQERTIGLPYHAGRRVLVVL